MKLISCVFLLAVFSAGAQPNRPDSVFSPEGNLLSVTDVNGNYTAYDDQGEITEQGSVKNGLKEGQWKFYFQTNLTAAGNYVKGKREGVWELFSYNSDGSNFAFVRSTGRYKNGQQEGEWKFYLGNEGSTTDADWINKKEFLYGYHILTGNYLAGLKTGEWVLRDISTGKTAGLAYFENGQKKAPWTLNKGLQSGNLLTISPYFLDSVEVKELYDNGNYAVGYFSHGNKTGIWKQYDANNQLIRSVTEGVVANNSANGDFTSINIVLPNLHTESFNRIIFSPDRKRVLLCNDKVSGELNYWLWDIDHKKMLSSGFFQTRKKEFYDITLSPSGKYFYLYNYTDSPPYTSVYLFDAASGSVAQNLSGEGYLSGHYFFYDEGLCLVADQGRDSLSFIGTDGKKMFTVPQKKQQHVRTVTNTTKNNEILVCFSDELVVYDLEKKKEVRSMPYKWGTGLWTDRNFLITGVDKFALYDLSTFKALTEFEIPGYESGKTDRDNLNEYIDFTVSPSGNTVAVAYEKNSGFSSPLQIVDLTQKTLVWKSPMNMGDCDDAFLLLNDSCIVLPRYSRKQDGYCSSQLHWFNFRKDTAVYSTQSYTWLEMSSVVHKKNMVALSYKHPGKIFNEKFNYIDLSTGHFASLRPWAYPKHFQLWSDSLFGACLGEEEKSAIDRDAFHYIPLSKVAGMNEKSHQLNDVFFSDVKTGGFDEKKFLYHAYQNKASYENKTKQGTQVVFWNGQKPAEAERKVTLSVLDNGEYIFYSPDRYYMGSKNISRHIYFEKDLKLYPFEQFDLKYNRPDLILSRLGYADSTLITAYRKAYLKRLKKMNFTEEMLKDDIHLPALIIQNGMNVPAVLQQDSIELNLEIEDRFQLLDRINIWINDVPVYGIDGISLRHKSIHDYKVKLGLKLASGPNKIQVSVLNQAGIESLKETVYTQVITNSTVKPDLYLVTIGAGKFRDAKYNLTYASKDALDIAAAFSKNPKNIYGHIYNYTLSDSMLTSNKLAQLKTWLKKCRRDDAVIITLSDHGVLDRDFNYYLATYDMDFEQPAQKGIPYEELENLLDGIAALKKLLLIDACHSGELDKEEVKEITASNNTTGSGIVFRNAGPVVAQKNLGVKSSTELVSELFTDLRKGTGATIISSAGGVEFAMESDQWKNGLFTWCLLQGLQGNKADLDNNGEIMVSELQQYLRQEVTKMSNGAQRPSSRLENTESDFRIW